MRSRRTHAAVLATLLALALAAPAVAQRLSDADIHDILVDRIDRRHDSVGIVVGIISPAGRRIISHGAFGTGPDTRLRPVDGSTLYEIGSITKVFTSLLLADMVRRGEVKLDDPVAMYLPRHVTVPARSGTPITLRNLATHRSGLPRMPTNYSENGPDDPQAVYTEDQLYTFLSTYAPSRDSGTAFDYSNVGAALLAIALTRRAGMSYDALVRERVLEPLGMSSTGFPIRPEHRDRMATGHTNRYTLAPAAEWNLPTFAGAGGLRSSASDMLNFLSATIGLSQGPVAESLASMLARRYDVAGNTRIGLGWFIRKESDVEIIFHNGGTFGYQSFIGFAPATRTGVIVLSNNGSGEGVSDIGRHILNPRVPLRRFLPADARPAAISSDALRAYAGQYESAGQIWTVRTDGARLFLQKRGEPESELLPRGDHHFVLTTADAEVTFEFADDAPGRARELALRRVWITTPQRASRVD